MVVAGLILGSALAAYHGYNAYRNYEKGKAYQQMERDFTRNTGRKVKYPAVNGYDRRAWDSYANAGHSAISGAYTSMGLYNQARSAYRSYAGGSSRDASKL